MNQLCLSVNLAYLLLIIVVYFTLFAHCLWNAIPICTIVLEANTPLESARTRDIARLDLSITNQTKLGFTSSLAGRVKNGKASKEGATIRERVCQVCALRHYGSHRRHAVVLKTCVVMPVERTPLGRISLVIAWT